MGGGLCAGVGEEGVLVWEEGCVLVCGRRVVCWCERGKGCTYVCSMCFLPLSAHLQVRPLGVPEWGALLDHYYTTAL